MDKTSKMKEPNKRQASLNLRPTSVSDTHQTPHATSPPAGKPSYIDIKPSFIKKPYSKNAKADGHFKFSIDTSKASLKLVNSKTFNAIGSARGNNNQSKSPKGTKSNANMQNVRAKATIISAKDEHPIYTERAVVEEEDLLFFSSNNTKPGKKSLLSLYLKPNLPAAIQLSSKNQKNSVLVKRPTIEIKKLNCTNINAQSEMQKSKAKIEDYKNRHIVNKTDVDFCSASTTDKTSIRECSLPHISSDLNALKDRVKLTLLEYNIKEKKMADEIRALAKELADTKEKLRKYENI